MKKRSKKIIVKKITSRDELNKKKVDNISKIKKELLELVLHLGVLYEDGMSTYKRPFSRPKYDRKRNEEYNKYLRVKSIEKHKWIIVKKIGDKLYYQLTEDGFLQALKARILIKEDLLPEGEFCLVVFDVPENMRHVRTAVRTLLKRAEFYQVQKSVWESEREVVEEIRSLVKALKAENYIRVYRALGER